MGKTRERVYINGNAKVYGNLAARTYETSESYTGRKQHCVMYAALELATRLAPSNKRRDQRRVLSNKLKENQRILHSTLHCANVGLY